MFEKFEGYSPDEPEDAEAMLSAIADLSTLIRCADKSLDAGGLEAAISFAASEINLRALHLFGHLRSVRLRIEEQVKAHSKTQAGGAK